MIKLAHDLYKDFEEEYFDWIKEKLHGGDKLLKMINAIVKKYPQYRIDSSKHEDFLKALLINPFSKTNREEFQLLEVYYQFALSNRKNPLVIAKGSAKISDISSELDYSRFMAFSRKNKTLREHIIKASRIEVCPYCNRQYIDMFQKSGKGYKAIAQLDHFYPKEQFPLYALSLYNFVPSCASCNQGKSDKTNELIYPFTEKSEEENQKPYFKIKSEDLDHVRGNVPPAIDYAFIDSDKKAHADSLHHKNMYQNHSVFAQRLLQRQRLYNQSYIAQVKEFFPRLSDEEIREVLFGFSGDLEELKYKPLSKLAHDILDLNKK